MYYSYTVGELTVIFQYYLLTKSDFWASVTTLVTCILYQLTALTEGCQTLEKSNVAEGGELHQCNVMQSRLHTHIHLLSLSLSLYAEQ